MKFNIRTFGLVSSLFLAACGGGGGGSTPTVAGPQAVALSETNAKPVAANALDAAQNTSASQSTGLVTGVEVQVDGATQAQVPLIAQVARSWATSLPALSGGTLATGVVVNQTQACPLGGTLTVSGNIANTGALSAGDTVGFTASNCQMDMGGVTQTMNGGMSITIVSGSVAAPPYHVVMTVTATNLSVQSGTETTVVSGDVRLDLNATSTSETLTVSGSSLTSRVTTGGTTVTTTLKNYSQTVTESGTTVSSTLAATVETDSTRLGSTGGSYTISTPTPLVWNTGSNTATSGVIKVVGAANAQLLITIAAGGVVTIQVDANGDGTFEKTISSTVSELATLR